MYDQGYHERRDIYAKSFSAALLTDRSAENNDLSELKLKGQRAPLSDQMQK
jgi:hypothetical protein